MATHEKTKKEVVLSYHLCPVCDSPLRQVHRRPIDRLISQFYPVHRYRCLNSKCGWDGLLHSKRHKAQRRLLPWWAWVLVVLLAVAIGLASSSGPNLFSPLLPRKIRDSLKRSNPRQKTFALPTGQLTRGIKPRGPGG